MSETALRIRRCWLRRAVTAGALDADLASALWLRPAELVALGRPLQCKGARRTVLVDWGGSQYVVKHYVEPGWWHVAKQHFLPSRAHKTWSVTCRLADAGIATPRPLAYVENRFGPLRRDSFLVYPYIEGRTLRSYFEAGEPSAVTESFWQQLRQLWLRLGQLRASLEDTNTANFIVSPSGELWVIDLDKARFYRSPRAAARRRERAWKRLLRSVAIASGKSPRPL